MLVVDAMDPCEYTDCCGMTSDSWTAWASPSFLLVPPEPGLRGGDIAPERPFGEPFGEAICEPPCIVGTGLLGLYELDTLHSFSAGGGRLNERLSPGFLHTILLQSTSSLRFQPPPVPPPGVLGKPGVVQLEKPGVVVSERDDPNHRFRSRGSSDDQ